MEMEATTGHPVTVTSTGVLADGTPAPPLPPLPPPPPPHQDQHPPRVSRYRSLRGKSLSSPRRSKAFNIFRDNDDNHGDGRTQDPAQPSPTRGGSQSATPERSHAAKECEHRRQQTKPPAPTTNLPLNPKPVNVPSPSSSTTVNSNLKPPEPPGAKSLNPATSREPAPSSPPPNKDPTPRPSSELKDQEARERKDREEAARWAGEVARLEAETDRILAEQKKRDLARLQAQLASKPSPKPRTKPQRLILDKLSSLAKGNKPNAAGQPTTPKSAPAKFFNINWTSPSTSTERTPSPDNMSLLEHGGVDAPASASNGGERRVTVRCLSSTINLAVTPDTSPVDIAYDTARAIPHKLDPATCVVIECYETLGLERRLRRYESIRDVMNSWDRDHQNSLLVLSYNSPPGLASIADLELASVPRTEDPPTGFTFQLHHSARPGKWNKRWITLMDSGQIFASKRPDAKSTDKDVTILCHLSDFDIFTPARNELKRDLKPPKKFCHAVKSQQKTSLFPTGENFVHFFSTEDEGLAQRFQELVFGWRSWYLANKKVDLQGDTSSGSLRRSTSSMKKSTGLSRYKSRRERSSGEDAPLRISSFKPLVDMQQFDKPIDEFGKDISTPRQSREASDPNALAKSRVHPPTHSQSPLDGSEFLAGGLLGHAYDQRKQADNTVTEVKKVEGPFTEGPSLLNNIPKSPSFPAEKTAEPSSWFPSALEHSARNRVQPPPSQRRPATASTAQPRREKPPPLPSGHSRPEALRPPPGQRQGVGRAVKPPNGAPLINFATGGTTSSQPGQPMPSRSSSRASTSTAGGPPGRARSQSTASRAGGQRYASADQPPVPPLPYRSAKRPGDGRMHTEPTRPREARPQEPLINRVK